MIKETVAITKREYDYMKDRLSFLSRFGRFVANTVKPVNKYGFAIPSIEEENGTYKLSWYHEDIEDEEIISGSYKLTHVGTDGEDINLPSGTSPNDILSIVNATPYNINTFTYVDNNTGLTGEDFCTIVFTNVRHAGSNQYWVDGHSEFTGKYANIDINNCVTDYLGCVFIG